MIYAVKIDTANAAFEETGALFEVGRILRALGQELQNGGGDMKVIKDHNGNTVGEAGFVGEKRS